MYFKWFLAPHHLSKKFQPQPSLLLQLLHNKKTSMSVIYRYFIIIDLVDLVLPL